MPSKKSLEIAKKFINFSNSSPTQFHCVATSISLLEKAGFKRINLRSSWKDLKPNGKFFFTRNESSLIAFAIGGHYLKGNGVTAIAAHTDSPCLQLKHTSEIKSKGYVTLGLETYGGGHFDSWFDRDLSLAGRVIIRKDENYETRLVDLKRPILSIPRLAIHLLSGEERSKGFKPNFENHLRAILCLDQENEDKNQDKNQDKNEKQAKYHPNELIQAIAEELNVSEDEICGLKLCLYDTQETKLGGLKSEFLFGGKFDNQVMTFSSLQALIDSIDSRNPLEKDTNIRLVALFDNEEVGSTTNRGADSRLLISSLEKIIGSEHLTESLEKSILVSADMAHAVHPNYHPKHETNSEVLLGKGLVIKNNANESYATTDLSSFFITEIAKKNELPIQQFCIRQDSRCGSTVGPMLSSNCGIRTVDVGVAQLAMHSIREICSVEDLQSSTELLQKVFEQFPVLDKKITVD